MVENDTEFTIRFKKPRLKKPKAWDKIKEAWDENPMLVVTVGTAAVAALGKLIDAAGSIQSKRAYAKQFNNKKKRKQGDDE